MGRQSKMVFLHRYEGILTRKRLDKCAGRSHECCKLSLVYGEKLNEQTPKQEERTVNCAEHERTLTRRIPASLINTFQYANVSKSSDGGRRCTIPAGADTTGSKGMRGGRTRKRRAVSRRRCLNPSVCGGLITEDFNGYEGLFFWLSARI